MIAVHISTHESFMHDAIVSTGTCPVCSLEGTHRMGWTHCHCSRCGVYYSLDDWRGSRVRQIRDAMGLSRKQFAPLVGVKPSTLKKAEFVRCSKPIFDKSLAAFTKYVLDREDKKVEHPELVDK